MAFIKEIRLACFRLAMLAPSDAEEKVTSNAGQDLLYHTDAKEDGGIIRVEIHLPKRVKLFRQAEPILQMRTDLSLHVLV